MDTATYHPLPDILLFDYQSFSGSEYLDILLFRIAPVNPHLRASSDPHPSNRSFPARSLFLQGWGLIDLPLRAVFSPAHPLADMFHPPYPPIALQSISRDVPLTRARP